MRDLGLDAALEAMSSVAVLQHTCDYATGAIKTVMPARRVIERTGFANLQVHRADLHGLLLEAVRANDPAALHAGHEFARLDQDANGVSVTFANGATDRAEALIGADGNASAVRSFLFRGEAARFNGQVALPTSWR